MKLFKIFLIIGIVFASCDNSSKEPDILGGWESHEQYLLNSDMSESVHQSEFTVSDGIGYIEIPLVTYGVYRTEIFNDMDCATISILPYPIDSNTAVTDEDVIYDIIKYDDGYVAKRFIQTIRIEANSSNPCTVQCRILARRGWDYYDYADIKVNFE